MAADIEYTYKTTLDLGYERREWREVEGQTRVGGMRWE
jgi:hypothetical protein